MKENESDKDSTVDIDDLSVCENEPKHTTLKIGHFQLNTSSFWISVICILCMFLIWHVGMKLYMYNKLLTKFADHEEKVIKMMLDFRQVQ